MTARPQDVALLPCPFCGLDVTDDEGCFPLNRERTKWEVRCGNPSCFAHDPCDESRHAAIARWNRRSDAALASAQAREEELRAEVERFRTAYHDGTLLLESAERAAAEAVNARESAQRDADRYRYIQRMWTVRLLNGGVVMRNAFGIEAKDSAEIDRIIDAALSTNAATQTGETT